MAILRIEHEVFDFDTWKQAFDGDPAGRQRSGVRRYQVMRASENPNYVLVDVEFDVAAQAEAFLAAMREIWGVVAGTLIVEPHARIVETVETGVY